MNHLENDTAGCMDPSQNAIVADCPVLDVVSSIARWIHRARNRVVHHRAVGWMKYPVKYFVVRGRVGRETEGAPATLVPHELVVHHVVVPRPDARRLRGETQPFLARTQLLLDRHLRGEIDVLENYMRHIAIFITHGKEMPLCPQRSSLTRRGDLGDVVPHRRGDDSLSIECPTDVAKRSLYLQLRILEDGVIRGNRFHPDSPHRKECIVHSEWMTLRVVDDGAERRLVEQRA